MKHGKRLAIVALALLLGLLLYLRLSGGAMPSTKNTNPENTSETLNAATLPPATPPVELKAILTAEELRAMDTSSLLRLDLTGSRCYEAIEEFRQQHPDVALSYAIVIDGNGDPLYLSPDTDTLQVNDASYLASLAENVIWLPRLNSISIESDIADSAAVDALHEAAPDCRIDYSLHLMDELYPYDIDELTLTGLNSATLQELLPQLSRFTHLTAVNIPQAENDLSLEDAMTLAEQSDVIRLDFQTELFGQPISLDAETLEYENEDIGNEGVDELRAILPYLKNLRYLKLDNCGVDDETMEKLRDDFPQVKVVWRVFFGSYHCLTDTEMIWATGGSVNDSTCGVLKYCTDVKYLDLGHTLMTKVDFLSYMPKLEVAILAISWVSDIGPIANCPNLEYLELFSTRVTDLSPLASCTHLQHLNVSHSVDSKNNTVGPTDISALYDLLELKRFYCTMSYVPEEQQKEMIERHPDCECEFRWVDPAEGAWRFDENGDRNERYSLLCEQFGYDTYQQSGKIWSLYG